MGRNSTFLERLRSFRQDVRGVSAVEFALVMPVVIVMYFGLVEFCQAFMAQRRMAHTTSQIADMVAQASSTSRGEIDAIMDIGSLIMAPFPEASLQMRITHIYRGSDGIARVVWSRGRGADMSSLSGVQTVPAGVIGNNEGIVLGEARYEFTSPLGKLLPNATRFNGRHYLRPRLSEQIACSDC